VCKDTLSTNVNPLCSFVFTCPNRAHLAWLSFTALLMSSCTHIMAQSTRYANKERGVRDGEEEEGAQLHDDDDDDGDDSDGDDEDDDDRNDDADATNE
jgi:hypothetical protein